jgi:chromosome segregation ATPase
MPVWVCALFLGTLVDAATLKTKVSPVQKVIELLDDLSGKVKADLQKEGYLMDEYTKWCDSESNEKEDAVAEAGRTINELKATIEESSGSISALTGEIEDLAGKISATEADLANATGIRTSEKAAFDATEKELVETQDSLERALVMIKRNMGFMQGKSHKQNMDNLVASLRTIVDASWISTDEKAKVQQLLQTEDSDEDLTLTAQPQAATSAYESHDGGILGTLTELKNKAEESLSKERKTEMEAQHAYELLKQSIEMELSGMQKRMSAATNERSSTEETMHAASAELEETKTSKSADEAYLADLKMDCAAKSTEWAERQKSVADELAAVAKAKEVLSSGVSVLLQVQRSVDDPDAEKRQRVTTILRNLAQEGHIYALSQLASEAAQDPFAKVKGLIESMIDRLMREAAEESDQKMFCDTEMAKSRGKQKDLAARADMHSVRIEKTEAGKAKLKEAISTLTTEISEIDAGMKEATDLRMQQKTEFDASSAEYKQSADAVANAIQVLQAYYSSGSFVQTGQAPVLGGARTDIGSTIISMLEVAESDFTQLLSEATAAETAASTAFEKLSLKNKFARAAKIEEVKGKTSELKTLEMNLLNYKEDRETTGKELDAVLAYLDKLKPQCETKVVSFGERKARREADIAGLKEALAILSD